MNGHIMYDISSMGRATCSQRPWASAEGSSVVQLKVYDIEGPFFEHGPYLSIRLSNTKKNARRKILRCKG